MYIYFFYINILINKQFLYIIEGEHAHAIRKNINREK